MKKELDFDLFDLADDLTTAADVVERALILSVRIEHITKDENSTKEETAALLSYVSDDLSDISASVLTVRKRLLKLAEESERRAAAKEQQKRKGANV